MTGPVICIGAALVDELFHVADKMLMHTTNEAIATRSAGGVSRNIAHQLSLLGVPVQLMSVFGNDIDGHWLKQICLEAGIRLDSCLTADMPTARYSAIIANDGSLLTALLTNPALHLIAPEYLQTQAPLLRSASWLLVDGNLTVNAINWIIEFTSRHCIPLVIEPVSVPAAKKISSADLKGVYLLTPNEDELPALCSHEALSTDEQVKELQGRGIQNIWLHKGSSGSTLYMKKETLHLPAPAVHVTDCTGAGDGAVSGFIFSEYNGGGKLASLMAAHALAAEILQVRGAIATHLNRERLLQLVSKYYGE